jgi:UDP-GlcNAc:undecaprenyl-phosphate GlcNAc-1-phosphate transferase
MNEPVLILAFLLSLMLALYGTPLAIRVARRYHILDHPDDNLKNHPTPTPYLGGLIVYFAFIAPISLLFEFNRELLGILLAGSILLLVGLFDDLKALNPKVKFFFQVIATYILLKSGISMKLVFLPPWLNIFLSFLWIVVVINAFNLIDIMDGLAGTVTLLSLVAVVLVSLVNRNFLIAILALSLGGAILGFLQFNWQPARIFLGDSGSMFIGLILGALVMMNDYSVNNDLGFISGFLILVVPLFELGYVSLVRLIRGRSIFRGSKDHLPLRLRRRFRLSSAGTVFLLGLIQLAVSAVVVTSYYSNPLFTLISSAAILFLLAALGIVVAGDRMA